METRGGYIPLDQLEVYQLAKRLSLLAWEIYNSQNWQDRKILGDQFIRSTDSVGANIAEGYFRYHYLDKIRFYYNARGSLAECWLHWADLLYERNKFPKASYLEYKEIGKSLSIKLNNLISSNYKSRNLL